MLQVSASPKPATAQMLVECMLLFTGTRNEIKPSSYFLICHRLRTKPINSMLASPSNFQKQKGTKTGLISL